jgi:DinB superfamily
MMRYDPALAIPVLERTPGVLRALLDGLPPAWTDAREGPEHWSPYEVVGHLVHGERTDWIPRAEMILRVGEAEPFPPFDRVAMLRDSAGRSLGELLDLFARLRGENVSRLRAMALTPADLARRGRHPELGPVTLGQHLATWVAHDLSHIRQIVRTMGREYAEAVGPWTAYLPMLRLDGGGG